MPMIVHATGARKYALPLLIVNGYVISDTASWCTVVNDEPVGPCTPTPVFVVPPVYVMDAIVAV